MSLDMNDQPRLIEHAFPHLRKIQKELKERNKDNEWKSYISELRNTHVRKRKLMEVLDKLDR